MQILKRIPLYGCLALLVYLPFHVFLSQSLSLVTGGLEIWKGGKDVILLFLCFFTICLVWGQAKSDRTFKILLGFTVIYIAVHLGIWALHPDIYERSAQIGLIYNMRLPLFLILGYSAVRLWPQFAFSLVMKLVLIVSTLVAGIGVLQFFLPQDILTHLGYSLDRGARASFSIDDSGSLSRIMSTLREPNALGAYLILPATALLALVLKSMIRSWRFLLLLSALSLHLLAILMTFSRSAWLGMVLAGILVVYWQYREHWFRFAKRFWPAVAGLVVIGAGSVYILQDSYFFQQYIIHSNPAEQVQDLDSNDYHALYIQQGLEGIKEEPLGHGPGTAGLASIQNPAGGQLTENYYVQIGYEIGVVGLLIFAGLQVYLYVKLWRQRCNSYILVVLCAGFWAYFLMNMLLHTWSNEAVAGQWWMLAGMTLALVSLARKKAKSAKVSAAD